jgi:hypothetical protein
MEQTSQTPQGKGLAVTGFVISLVGLVFYWMIAGIVGLQALAGGGYGLGIFWLVLCLAGTIMAVMGMQKLGKTGGKKGLAIAGLVIGAVATILSLLLVIGIGGVQDASTDFQNEYNTEIEALKDSLGVH